jgi:hypothetical protein
MAADCAYKCSRCGVWLQGFDTRLELLVARGRISPRLTRWFAEHAGIGLVFCESCTQAFEAWTADGPDERPAASEVARLRRQHRAGAYAGPRRIHPGRGQLELGLEVEPKPEGISRHLAGGNGSAKARR